MKKAGMITGGIVLFTGLFALAIFVSMWLWNWLMPLIFSLPEITFWQTAGVIILSKIIFSGFRHERSWHRDYKKREWHEKFLEKFRNDPESYRHRFTAKCGGGENEKPE